MLRGNSNEYPQHMFLWRTIENYSLIIIKYPPYLFDKLLHGLIGIHILQVNVFCSIKIAESESIFGLSKVRYYTV